MAPLGDDLIGDILGDLHIAVGLHRILAAALGAGARDCSSVQAIWLTGPTNIVCEGEIRDESLNI